MKHPNPTIAHQELMKQTNVVVNRQILNFGPAQEEAVFMYNLKPGRKPKNKLEREANGLILAQNGEVVSMGHPIVRDAKECALDVRWGKSWIEPEFEGTYVVVYNYRGKTFVQTRWVADLSTDESQECLYTDICDLTDDIDFRAEDADPDDKICWAFKYVENKVELTAYRKTLIFVPSNELVLLSAFNKRFNRPVVRHYVERFADKYNLISPERFFVHSKSDMLEKTKCCQTSNFKSFILTDNRGVLFRLPKNSPNPIKAVLKLGAKVEPIHLAKMVIDGEYDEVLQSCAAYEEPIEILEGALNDIIEDVDFCWTMWSGKTEERQKFASLVKSHPLNHILFDLWDERLHSLQELTRRIKPEFLLKSLPNRKLTALEKAMVNLKEKLAESENNEKEIEGVA